MSTIGNNPSVPNLDSNIKPTNSETFIAGKNGGCLPEPNNVDLKKLTHIEPKEVDEIGKALKNTGTAKTTIKFGDNDLKDAKLILADMMAENPDDKLASLSLRSFELNRIVDNMDASELGEFAGHISNLIKNTDGKDSMLTKLFDRVINEIKNQPGPDKIENSFPTTLIQSPPWLNHSNHFDGHIITKPDGSTFTLNIPPGMKYTCSYSNRKISI